MKKLVAFCLTSLILSTGSIGAQVPGDSVRVHKSDKRLIGSIIAIDSSSIRFWSAGVNVSVAHNEIRRLDLWRPIDPGERFTVAFLGAAATGSVFWLIEDLRFSEDAGVHFGITAAIGLVSLLIDFALRPGKWVRVR